MLKTFYFTIPQVDLFSRYKHDFQPLYPDTTTVRYETDKIQLTDTYLDYHSVLIYRMEAYVSESCNLPLKTEKSDFHLLYTMSAPRPIIIQNRDNEDQITLPSSSGTYIYVPKGKYDIHVHHGHYDVFGLLIDVGFIRADIFSSSSFYMNLELHVSGIKETIPNPDLADQRDDPFSDPTTRRNIFSLPTGS